MKRWDMYVDTDDGCDCYVSCDAYEDSKGAWVKFEDVKERITALCNENHRLRNVMGECAEKLKLVKTDGSSIGLTDNVEEDVYQTLKSACDNGIEGDRNV